MPRSALSEDRTGATSANNHSIFKKWFWVKLLGLKRGILHHKMAPRPQKHLNWPKNTKHYLQNTTLSGDPSAVTLVINHSIFIQWPWKSYWGSWGGSYIARWLPDHKNQPESVKKRLAKIISKIAHSALSGDLIAVTSVTNHSFFIRSPYILK